MLQIPRTGGSSIARVLRCPGSVRLCMSAVDTRDDEFSGPGRVAHKIAEWALKAGYRVEQLVGRKIEVDGKSFDITPEFLPVQIYVDHVRAQWVSEAVRATSRTE